MKQTRTLITLGLIHNLQQMKNPITNIMLSVELVAAETNEDQKQLYYTTIKTNTAKLQNSILEMCEFFKDLDSDAAKEKESISKIRYE